MWHTIADVERDTGLAKDTLRVWERRYGFPMPRRDELGERQYDDDQLLRLRHIRRLLDAGHRPGRLVRLSLADLIGLHQPAGGPDLATEALGLPVAQTAAGTPGDGSGSAPDIGHWLALLRRQDTGGLRQALTQTLRSHGLARMITEGVAPMNVRVGQAWLDGELAVFEEHLYTEIVQMVLRHALHDLVSAQPPRPPRVLLTTLPGEWHGLGLLMAECFLAMEGCQTLSMGVQTPLPDMVTAARVGRADIVAIGFTAAQNPREVRASLAQLRERLPASVDIWAGGQCPALYRPARRQKAAGDTPAPMFWPVPRVEDIRDGVARWRAAHGVPMPAPGP